jgi:hypothetical protein
MTRTITAAVAYFAAPRRNRNRDAFEALGRIEGPGGDILATSAELLATANELRAYGEKIGRAALRARLQAWSHVDDQRMVCHQIYAIGGRQTGDPLNPFPRRAPKAPMVLIDAAPRSLPPVAILLDETRHLKRGWIAARDVLTGHGALWGDAFHRAMFDQATISDCVRYIRLPEHGASRRRVQGVFAQALLAARKNMLDSGGG